VCVCGLEPETESCCGRYIHGGAKVPTAEALMRSRYTAYVLGEIDYLVSSHDPAKRDEIDSDSARQWSREAEWRGLEVHEAKGGPEDDEGVVEFTARYEMQGRLVRHRERAIFRRIDGTWYYHDGDMVKAKPVEREGPKTGRNDPCPCGSGLKYKRCHGK
jgi:SEC-C motif-containing protein